MKAAGAIVERPGEDFESIEAPVPPCRRMGVTLWLWGITLFSSALLLFAVQPMVARMLLPQLGGTPTVWNTCMVFFQILLLGGYAYAHLIASRLPLKAQWIIHGALVSAALFALPIALPQSIHTALPSTEHPTLWLLKILFLVAGLPFFVISSTGPLLQNWFSRTNHPSARDPYFLYGASNLGSLIALLGYPVLLEPTLRLKQQSALWSVVYGGFLLLLAACAVVTQRTSIPKAAAPQIFHLPAAAVSWSQRFAWVLLAFVPSSLMLGVTTYLTTDIASVPLLWVVPLALYLLTYIMAFGKQRSGLIALAARALPIAVVALLFFMLTDTRNPAWLLVALHLVFFFLAALLCHTRLADQRPAAGRLTEFYLWLSVGGALGGSFNALLAPVLFRTVAEYPLMIVVACLVSSKALTPGILRDARWPDCAIPAMVGVGTALLARWIPKLELGAHQLLVLIIFGLPLILCYFLSKRPLRFALALGALMIGAQFYTAFHGKVLHAERNFFGALRVTLDPSGQFRRFYHGTTVHGCQFIDPGRQREPVAYYHRTGPFGVAYDALTARHEKQRIAAIGLGAGGVAAYARAGQHWTFYEIDPAVIKIARDTNFFTFLSGATDAALEYKLGDARLRLQEAPAHGYTLIISDAFSSDVPPLHLITREGMELYLSKLAPDGAVLFHISSRYLDFGPVLAGLGKALGLHCLEYNEAAVDQQALENGRFPSRWVAIARDSNALGTLMADRRWTALQPREGMDVWTDDFSNLLSIFDWR